MHCNIGVYIVQGIEMNPLAYLYLLTIKPQLAVCRYSFMYFLLILLIE